MKTENYKITWTTDDTYNLYGRTFCVKTDDLTIGIYIEDELAAECEICEEDDIVSSDFITDNYSWLTECDDRFIIGTTERGDFVELDLL